MYVDDLLIMGSSTLNIIKFKQQMNCEFEMSDMSKLSYYLGIEVCQIKAQTEIKQAVYARRLQEKADMVDCQPVRYLMEAKVVLTKVEQGKPVNAKKYRSIVGGLRYLVNTRLDIAFGVGMVSRF